MQFVCVLTHQSRLIDDKCFLFIHEREIRDYCGRFRTRYIGMCEIYTWVIVQIGQGKTNISIKIMYNKLSFILSNTMYGVLITYYTIFI